MPASVCHEEHWSHLGCFLTGDPPCFLGYPKQRTTAPRNGFSPKPDPQAREAERLLAQRLKERYEQQARQLGLARAELRTAVRGFQALAVATQLFFGKVGHAWWMWKRRAVAGMVLSVRALIRVWG